MSDVQIKKTNELQGKPKIWYNYAQKAIQQKNYGYAVEMLCSLLQQEPGCEEARQQLRECQVKSAEKKLTPTAKALNEMMSSIVIPIKGGLLGNNFAKTLALAEKYLSVNPKNVTALNYLIQQAEKAGLAQTHEAALKMRHEAAPKNESFLNALIDYYTAKNDKVGILTYMQVLARLKPQDMGLQNALKQATADATMQKDNWEKADSYRDIMKDKEEASLSEQLEKGNLHDEDSLVAMIRHMQGQAEAVPSVANFKRLADLYKQHDDFDEAIEAYTKTLELMGTFDPNVDDAITDCRMGQFKQALAEWEAYGESSPEAAEEAKTQMEIIRQQQEDVRFERYKERAERYPNDAMYRFTLAELYFQRDMFDQAIAEYQASVKNPQLRGKSTLYLGKCMIAKGMYDFAIEQFERAKTDFPSMDSTKKDLLYNLSEAYEKVAKYDKAIEALKEIYFSDSGYRNIGEKITQLTAKIH